MKAYIALLLLAPLIGALINGFRWSNERLKPAAVIGCTCCITSFLVAISLFFQLLDSSEKSMTIIFSEWLSIDSFSSSFSVVIDPLSILMLLVITGVGSLIHVFSVYYMSEDQRPAKYFSYLNLFILSMMILVLAEDLLLMFVGWEAVGLCSYLLIGFWFTDQQKATAGMKAFLFNRLGDVGFLVGLFLMLITFDSLNITNIKEQVAAFFSYAGCKLCKVGLLIFFLGSYRKICSNPTVSLASFSDGGTYSCISSHSCRNNGYSRCVFNCEIELFIYFVTNDIVFS